MIVRDEAELLPRFLAQARGLWSELVAVDTGSTDATPRILEQAGARLLHQPWTGDFAAARNRGLEVATGEWVAVLDADELVSPELVGEISALALDAGAGAATIRMVNALPHGHARESRLLRLWRHGPGIRFRHAIHEDASEAVFAALALSGQRLVHLEGRVDHLGYVRDRAAARRKKERDVGILERVLAADPADLYSHLKLLEQARFWGDRELWRRAAAAAKRAVEAAPDRLSREPLGGELVALVADGLAAHPAAALALLDGLADRVRPSAAFQLRRGELRELTGDPSGAEASFRACLGLAATTANRQLATVRPRLGLARLEFARGALPAALALVEEALSSAPRDPEALLFAVALQRARGGGAAVDAFARARAATGGEELWAALGEEALRAGDLERALPALSQAAGDPPRGPPARLLALARLASGDTAGAAGLAEQLEGEDPAAELVGLLAAIARGGDLPRELKLAPAEAEPALRDMAGMLRAAARPEVLSRLRAAAPALGSSFPWLGAALGERPRPARSRDDGVRG